MKIALRNKIRQIRAFTLVEMLLVVGIMILFSSVAVVGISSVSGFMNEMELDNYAKSIYMQAQNQLTAKKIEGGLEELQKALVECI